MNTQPTMQNTPVRALSRRTLRAAFSPLALAALLALLLSLGLGQLQTARA